jgi:hypothetical protein
MGKEQMAPSHMNGAKPFGSDPEWRQAIWMAPSHFSSGRVLMRDRFGYFAIDGFCPLEAFLMHDNEVLIILKLGESMGMR